ncbi:outer membrane protein with glycine zipper [Pseudaminobacter salicylatoxidans]|uniref:Outer membrane protein with glycine zipper n=1 Tax=Pseudaminobacter salicylatoxidans TaxID=93369 RepID=A0A316CA38_PSESE|nr:glycine zipper domain-containing protein [Pseudaminobacter salicylatoxidans]PWJ85936.1 outer membrane protein with glycine zipper [Pseudaminobacter salicylatoxidans]
MRNVLFALAATAALAACTPTEQGAFIGGATGAAVGGAVSGDVGGALIGGAIGATAGALIGRASEPGRCYFRDRHGRRYVARCPRGYRW